MGHDGLVRALVGASSSAGPGMVGHGFGPALGKLALGRGHSLVFPAHCGEFPFPSDGRGGPVGAPVGGAGAVRPVGCGPRVDIQGGALADLSATEGMPCGRPFPAFLRGVLALSSLRAPRHLAQRDGRGLSLSLCVRHFSERGGGLRAGFFYLCRLEQSPSRVAGGVVRVVLGHQAPRRVVARCRVGIPSL